MFHSEKHAVVDINDNTRASSSDVEKNVYGHEEDVTHAAAERGHLATDEYVPIISHMSNIPNL